MIDEVRDVLIKERRNLDRMLMIPVSISPVGEGSPPKKCESKVFDNSVKLFSFDHLVRHTLHNQ